MMNMSDYYDFSGQKFGYPLSLSINSFERHIFSRQKSLELSYVLQGEYQIVTEKFTSKLSKGELLMIAPGDIHLITHKKDGVILTIHIDFDRMTSAMSGNSTEAFSTMIVTNQAYDQLKNKISGILKLIRQENYNLYTLNAYMMDILSIASQVSFSMSSLPLQDEAHKNYMQAILYIDSHYNENLTLGDVADTLSFSLSYTSKLFKKFTGITFVKYLNSVRIRASLEDLLEGIKNISEISDECGMPNSKAYTEAFKEIYGISPSNYRKRFKKNFAPTEEREMNLDNFDEILEDFINEEETIYEDEKCKITLNAEHIKLESEEEIKISKQVVSVSQTIINNANLLLQAKKYFDSADDSQSEISPLLSLNEGNKSEKNI